MGKTINSYTFSLNKMLQNLWLKSTGTKMNYKIGLLNRSWKFGTNSMRPKIKGHASTNTYGIPTSHKSEYKKKKMERGLVHLSRSWVLNHTIAVQHKTKIWAIMILNVKYQGRTNKILNDVFPLMTNSSKWCIHQ